MTDNQAIAAEEDLDSLYDEVVNSHRKYLEKVQAAFDKHCEEIGEGAKKKLKATAKDDKEGRKQILMEEQKLLDETLAELKQVVTKRDANVRKKLEDIENKRDEKAIDIDAELANL